MNLSRKKSDPSRDREFTVVLEDLRSQFRVFGEHLHTAGKKLETLDEVNHRLRLVEADVTLIKLVMPKLATKDELSKLVTKDEISKLATKDDLGKFATKEDLSKLATKNDLSKLATKDEFNELKTQLEEVRTDITGKMDRFFNTLSDHEHRITHLEKIR